VHRLGEVIQYFSEESHKINLLGGEK